MSLSLHFLQNINLGALGPNTVLLKQNAGIIQYRHDTGTNLSISGPPAGLADPVEPEDEEHRP